MKECMQKMSSQCQEMMNGKGCMMMGKGMMGKGKMGEGCMMGE